MGEEKKDMPILSLVQQERKMEHTIQMEDNEYNNTWKSFCFVIDKRAIVFFTQIGVISGTMGFCIYKLTTNDSCDIQSPYLALLTTLVGCLLPQPNFGK
jgi:hypothetical protein